MKNFKHVLLVRYEQWIFFPSVFVADKEKASLWYYSNVDCKVAAFRVKTSCVYNNYLNSDNKPTNWIKELKVYVLCIKRIGYLIMAAATSSSGKAPDPGSVLRNLCQLLLVKKQHQLLLEQTKINNEPSNRISSTDTLQNMILPVLQRHQNNSKTQKPILTGKLNNSLSQNIRRKPAVAR